MIETDEARLQRMQENLATIRKVAGWSAQRLADEIGVTRQTVSNLERGKTPLTKTQYIALRYVFNLEVAASENQALAKVISALVDDPIEDEDDVEAEGTMGSLSATTSLLAADVQQGDGRTALVSLPKNPLIAGMLAGAMGALLPGAVLLAPISTAMVAGAAAATSRRGERTQEPTEGGCHDYHE